MTKDNVIIREVWASNLHKELALIRAAALEYRFASFDTEFPGTIFATPNMGVPHAKLSPFTNFQYMKLNVDALNIIQFGLCLSDDHGNLPQFRTSNRYIWQFNFSDFDIDMHPHNVESIKLLMEQGIDLEKNKREGIPTWVFREFMLKSGLLFNPYVTWITFHSSYDFGLMIKLLIGGHLPPNIHLFRCLVAHFFGPKVFDIKHMIKFCSGLYGGLDRVAKTLNVDRIVGKSHQAGSDSLLILQTFMKLKETYFNANSELKMYEGILYGLDVNDPGCVVFNIEFSRHCFSQNNRT